MKIALVSQEYPPQTARGGIGTQTFLKAQGLSGLGHEIFVVSRSIGLERLEQMEDKVRVIRIPGMESLLPEMTDPVQWITHSMTVAAELEALHQREKLDLVDFPEWAAESFIFLLNRTPWKNICTVIQLHGPLVMLGNTLNWPPIDSEFFRTGTFMEATCLNLCDAIYSSSKCSADWVTTNYLKKE